MGQWYALCYMIVCGVIMGLVCEIFDVVRALTKAGQVFGATLDVIMCAALAVLATVMLVQANGGDVHMYAFLGCAVGWALFKLGPARISFGCMLEIFRFSDIFLNKCFDGRIWRICGE